MSDLDDVHITAINRNNRIAVAEEGLGEITCFLDDDHEETEDPEEWVYAVIEWEFGGYTVTPLDDYEGIKTN